MHQFGAHAAIIRPHREPTVKVAGSTSEAGPAGAPAYPVVIEPNSPSSSSFGPAVKNSVVTGPLLAAPCPNSSAHRPSMAIRRLSAPRS
jgi:hypothetical protein